MRTIVAGSRSITDSAHVVEALWIARTKFNIVPTVVLSGAARGVDLLGEAWAEHRLIEVERHIAHWGLFPRTAGRLRNSRMAHAADALVAIWDGSSPGTAHMIYMAESVGLTRYVHKVRV